MIGTNLILSIFILLTNNKELGRFISDLDTERFGFPVARVKEWDKLNPTKLLHQLEDNGIKLVISKIPEDEITTLQKLKSLGFKEMDKIIHLEREFPKEVLNLHFSSSEFEYREASEQDVPQLQAIAQHSFLGGHYFADPKLDKTRCKEIYPDWILRSCTGEIGDKVYVAHLDNEIAGFATFEIKDSFTLWAGIGATNKNFRNKGVCRSILQFGINEYFRENRFKFFGSAISKTNSPVNKVFSDLGCHPTKRFYILHGWLAPSINQ